MKMLTLRARASVLFGLCIPLVVFANLAPANEPTLLEGKLTAATVFADRAEITYTTQANLKAGTQTLILSGLPANTNTSSLRVQGSSKGSGGFTLVSVEAQTVQQKTVQHTQLQTLLEQKNTLELERTAVQQGKARLNASRNFAKRITHSLTSEGAEAETPTPIMDPAAWSSLLSAHATWLNGFDAQERELHVALKAVNENINLVERQIRDLRAHSSRSSTQVTLTVNAPTPTQANLNITAMVYGASWQPLYTLYVEPGVAATEAPTATLIARAQVRQNTGETWENITLTLSTAQPAISGSVPELNPWFLNRYQPPQPRALKRAHSAESAMLMQAAAPAHFGGAMLAEAARYEDIAMESAHASAFQGMAAATYTLSAPVTLPSGGGASAATLTLAQHTLPINLRHTAVPKLSQHVYLTGELTNTTGAQLLPGQLNIHLEGNYVGETYLEPLAQGESKWIGLGADPAVRAVRVNLGREEDDKGGLIGKFSQFTYNARFNVENLSARATTLVLKDQLPISNHDEILITLLQPKAVNKGSGSPTLNDEGMLEWTLNLEPGAEEVLPFSFRVRHPADFQVGGM